MDTLTQLKINRLFDEAVERNPVLGELVDCPRCQGNGQWHVTGFFHGSAGCEFRENMPIPCDTCHESGQITQGQKRAIRIGRWVKAHRTTLLRITVREAATALGWPLKDYLALEQGRYGFTD